MENSKYNLSKKGKHICPKCNKKTFVLYIDKETGKPLHSTVGRCDRENNCACHYPPKQYFSDNNFSFDSTVKYIPPPKPKLPPSYIEKGIFKQSLQGYENNNFVKYLCDEFGEKAVKQAIERYYIGTSKHWYGATVFWQIDLQGKVRTGKIMLYDETGHRRKDIFPLVQWVHGLLESSNYNLVQCLFGEHLLKDSNKTVCIVESEKTAIIASIYFPNFIWLACGGSNGLNIEKCQCLKGRNVILYPDCEMFDKWKEKAKEMSFCKVSVSNLMENNASEQERKQGFDLADCLLKQPCFNEILPDKNKKERVNFENEISHLEAFFKSIMLPTNPIKLNHYETVTDTNSFINSHLSILKNYSKNKTFFPYLQRLQQLKKAIEA